jgi:deazaflavin-dependent oxidoreductase (nitroreductase family)
MKHQIVHALQKYVLNPPIKLLFAMGVVPPGYALLETIGRTTGKPRRTPVGNARIGNCFWIVAEHCMKEGYVRNLVRHPRVRVKLRQGLGAQWHTGTAHVLPGDCGYCSADLELSGDSVSPRIRRPVEQFSVSTEEFGLRSALVVA